MLVLTCISLRSAASVKSVGACRLAATVWPTSTERAITMPSIGEVMMVFCRLTSAWVSDGSRLRQLRLRAADLRLRRSAPRRPPPRGRSPGCSCFSASSCARVAFICASASVTCARWRSACALVRLARAESTCVWNSDGSSRASTCPLWTIELKSAFERLDGAGHLAADLDRRHRLERAGRRNLGHDRPAGDRRR